MYLKVDGTNFVKDSETGAILSVSKSVLNDNLKRKKLSKQMTDKNNEINTLKDNVTKLNNEITEIKSLLTQLLQSKQ